MRKSRTAVSAATGAGLLALASLLTFAPAAANDSSASLDVGGLKLTYNPNVSVESEDLYLSRDEVRVTYHFRNRSDHDISTLVAFPLPTMEIGEEGNYILEGKDPVNVMDFQVTVDGKQVEPSVEVKATRFGVDVTDVLKRYNIPLTTYDRLNTLPEDARRELEHYGVIDWETATGAEDKPLATTHWETHIVFYWFQTFPAGRSIEVTHRYHPVPRHFFFGKEDLASPEMRKTYCFDADFVRSAQAKLAQSSQDILKGYELKYVLTTAENWLGPIGKFKLTVDKTTPDALVSLCAQGIKKAGPTTFVLAEEDLSVLFLEPLKEEN
jgi:hypothetical protein